jgi:hypothetical protein
MELFGLGWIIRHFGHLGYAVSMFIVSIAGMAGGFLGLYYARQNKLYKPSLSLKDDRQIAKNVIKYSIFLWCVWLLTFGIQYWIFYGFWPWLLFAVLVAVGSYFLSLVTTGIVFNLIDQRFTQKAFFWCAASCVGVTLNLVMWGIGAGTISLTKQELLSYYSNLLTKEGENYEEIFSTLKRMKIEPQPYFYAVANLRQHNRDKAAKYFQDYAYSLPVEEQALWLAFSHFFRNEFWSAASLFIEADQEFYALLSFFRGNQLSSYYLESFINSRPLGNDKPFFDKMYKVVIVTEGLQRSFSKMQSSELKELRIPYALAVEEVWINQLRQELNAEIERRMIDFALKQAPPLSVPAMREFKDSEQYKRNWSTVLGTFPSFLYYIFVVSIVWIELGRSIKKIF